MSTICYYLLSHIEHQISSNINIYLWNDLGWPMRPIYPKKCGGFITLKPNHFSINIPETSHIPHVLFLFFLMVISYYMRSTIPALLYVSCRRRGRATAEHVSWLEMDGPLPWYWEYAGDIPTHHSFFLGGGIWWDIINEGSTFSS